MNREIKFRVFNVDNKRWVDNLSFNISDFSMSTKPWFRVMQYTGLKDKNGKEIYEGDVVNSYYEIMGTHDGKEYFRTGKYKYEYLKVVEFKNGSFWCGSIISGKTLEVIGNIYENPEFLK